MRKSKVSEEQIIGFLKQAEAGIPIAETCRKGGFSDAAAYKAQEGSQSTGRAPTIAGGHHGQRPNDGLTALWAH